MKVLISTDIEGVAGVFHSEQTRPGNKEYETARVWMAQEANAAVVGAFDGGATAVWVNDSHAGFRNISADAIDERAAVILGKPRVLGMMAGLEFAPDLVFMIGYHARAQSQGILAHTINGFAFARVFLNDVELGEAGLYGALAAERHARVALLSGDDVFAKETQPTFPHARFICVKTAFGQFSGSSCTPQAARTLIRDAARDVVRQAMREAMNQTREHPWQDGDVAINLHSSRNAPQRCELHVQSPALADLFCQMPTLTRISGVCLRFEGPSVEYIVRTLNCLSAMSQMLR